MGSQQNILYMNYEGCVSMYKPFYMFNYQLDYHVNRGY